MLIKQIKSCIRIIHYAWFQSSPFCHPFSLVGGDFSRKYPGERGNFSKRNQGGLPGIYVKWSYLLYFDLLILEKNYRKFRWKFPYNVNNLYLEKSRGGAGVGSFPAKCPQGVGFFQEILPRGWVPKRFERCVTWMEILGRFQIYH